MLSLGILCASFALLWPVNKRLKGRFLTPSGILLAAYCLCSLGTVCLYYYDKAILDPVAITYYVVALGALLLPIVGFDETHSVAVQPNDTKIELYVSRFLAIFGIYSMAYNFPALFVALKGDLNESRIWTGAVENNVATIASVFATFAAYLFSLMMPLGFYWIATRRRWLLGTALLAASCSYVVFVLSHVGRDALIIWGSAFAFNLLLFLRNLSARAKTLLLVSCSVMVSILAILFYMITVDRFSAQNEKAIYTYASYAGQSPIHFSEWFLGDRPLYYGQYNFNIFYRLGSLFGVTEWNQEFVRDAAQETMVSEKYYLNVFASIVGSVFLDFGYGTIMIFVGVAIVMCVTLGRGGKRIPLWKVIIYTTYMQVMTGGMFFYYYYGDVGNGALAFSVGTAVAVKYARVYKQKLQVSEALVPSGSGGARNTLNNGIQSPASPVQSGLS